MGCILGIDQGGSNTRAAVLDPSGNILSYCRAEGSYFPLAGLDAAMRPIMLAAENALEGAMLSANDIDTVVAGVTGIDWQGDDVFVSCALGKRFASQEIIACNDCEIAYYGGSAHPAGAVLCAGTGMNAALFAPGGRKFVMGDYLKGSLQGGTAIGTRAIEAVFESDLGLLPKTELTKLFLGFSGDGSVNELLRRHITEMDFRKRLKSLVPQIIDAAGGMDAVARGVLEAFANEACSCFAAAMKKMGMLKLKCDIVLAGGVFMGGNNCLTEMIARKIAGIAENAIIVNARFEPVVGACILGMLKKLGRIDERVARNIAATAEKYGLMRAAPEI
jgi:N-acetylglucosamine kinase